MQLESLKLGSKVWDDECAHFGEGLIVAMEDDLVEVFYKDIEETVGYSLREANKHLNLIL